MNGDRVRDKLERLRAITSEQQKRGAGKLQNSGNSGDGTIQGIMDTIADTSKKIQSKTVKANAERTEITPDEGFYLENVTVLGISAKIIPNGFRGETLIIGGDLSGA